MTSANATLTPSAPDELLEALRPGDGLDPVREAVRRVAHGLIEAEAAQATGRGDVPGG